MTLIRSGMLAATTVALAPIVRALERLQADRGSPSTAFSQIRLSLKVWAGTL